MLKTDVAAEESGVGARKRKRGTASLQILRSMKQEIFTYTNCPVTIGLGSAEYMIHDLRPALRAWAGVWQVSEQTLSLKTGREYVLLVALDETRLRVRHWSPGQDVSLQRTLLKRNETIEISTERQGRMLALVIGEKMLRQGTLAALARQPGHYEALQGLREANQDVGVLAALLAAEPNRKTQDSAAYRTALMLSLIECVAADRNLISYSSGTSDALNSKIQEVLDLIENNISHSLPLAFIAKEVGVSQYHLARNFRKAMGVGVLEYKRRKRLEVACRLLSETHDPLTEIAHKCGFSSQSHMNNVFRELLDMTPLEYRAACWNSANSS